MAGSAAPRTLALLALVGLSSSVARAEPRDDARRYFLSGLDQARAGDFEEALRLFLTAHEIFPHPVTLHNIARCYYNLGRLEEALSYYRLYQVAAPADAANYDGVIAVLEARIQQERAPAPSASPATGSLAATSDEVERLKAIAEELAQLGARLQERGSRASDEVPEGEGTTTEAPTAAPSPEPPAQAPGDLLAGAYERVVVTASRYGQSPLDSPSTITILSGDDIRLSGAFTLADVLRRVAGIDVMTLAAGQADVSIRGFNRELANKVLVLVDGRSIYLDMLGTVLWETLPVALEEIDRVEVVRGPGSAVYGANAVTGVINIITQAPGTGRSQLVGSLGTAGAMRAEAIATGRVESTGWRLSTGYRELGRWETTARPEEVESLRPFLDEDDVSSRVLRINGRVDRALGGDAFASLAAGHSRGFTEYYVFGALGNYVTEFDHSFARGDLGFGPMHVWAFYNRFAGPTGPWLERVGQRSLATEYDARTFDLEVESDVRVQTGPIEHRVNAGLGYRHKQVAWDYLEGDGEPIAEDHYNAFVQDAAAWGALTMVGSLRLDRHPLVDVAQTISPRGALILRLREGTALRANAGTSFRSPTFMESYLDLQQPTEADGIFVDTLGNRELLPERILTGEIGLHDASSRLFEGDLALYVNRVTDLIYVGDLVRTITPFDPEANGFSAGSTTFTNLAPSYTAMGGELEGRIFPSDGLDVYANAAVERILESDGGVTVVDESTSTLKGNLGLMYRSPWRVDLSSHVQALSAQTWRLREFDDEGQLVVAEESIPARAILSAQVAARPMADGALELSLSGWNLLPLLTGEGFREHPKGQRVGSRIFGNATWRF